MFKHVCMCMHNAGRKLFDHPSVLSIFSTLSEIDPLRQPPIVTDLDTGELTVPSAHTHKGPTQHETQLADDFKE